MENSFCLMDRWAISKMIWDFSSNDYQFIATIVICFYSPFTTWQGKHTELYRTTIRDEDWKGRGFQLKHFAMHFAAKSHPALTKTMTFVPPKPSCRNWITAFSDLDDCNYFLPRIRRTHSLPTNFFPPPHSLFFRPLNESSLKRNKKLKNLLNFWNYCGDLEEIILSNFSTPILLNEGLDQSLDSYVLIHQQELQFFFLAAFIDISSVECLIDRKLARKIAFVSSS